MDKIIKQRFGELAEQLQKTFQTATMKHSEFTGNYQHIESNLITNWSVKVKNLLSKICTAQSEQLIAFNEAEKLVNFDNNVERLKRMEAVFLAIKEDYEGGYLRSSRNLIQAEVFDTELEQASELLQGGYYTAAAVIAGVVLETSMRDLCIKNEIEIGNLNRMNADLAKKEAYSKLLQKRITALSDIRNSAAHGRTENFTEEDVKSMIAEVQRIVTEWLD